MAVIALLLFAAVVGLLVLTIIQKKKTEKRRTEALRARAIELGWSFEEAAAVDSVSGLDRFAYFDRGYDKHIRNLMYREDDKSSSTVFDYVFITSSSKYETTNFQTMVRCESDDYAFPDFTASPESPFDKVFSAFGYQDLDFDHHPEFSRRYIVRGEDEAAIRDVFSDDVLSFFEEHPGTFADAIDNQLFVYCLYQRVPPEEVESFVELAQKLLSLMPPTELVEEDSPSVDADPTESDAEELTV